METPLIWIALSGLLAALFVVLLLILRLREPKQDPFWLEDDTEDPDYNLDLDLPPEDYVFDIDSGTSEQDCDWSVKYASAVDNTDNPTSWKYLKQAKPAEKECARYEVLVSSALNKMENPDSKSTDKQVNYGGIAGYLSWWETVKEYMKRKLSWGYRYEGLLKLGVYDYGPIWGRSPTPTKHLRSRSKRSGVPVRSHLVKYNSKMAFHETVTIKIKLEKGQHKECFPENKHEFWATAASGASANLAWRCANPDNRLISGCRSSAPADGSPPGKVMTRVGSLVRCTTIPQLNYELVKPNDLKVKKQWNANSLGGSISADIAPTLSLTAGPLQLGQVSASFKPKSHNRSSNAGDSVIKKPTRGSKTSKEFVLTIDTYFDAELELQSDKDDNYSSSVSIEANNKVYHHMRIIGRTDADAPCQCCKPRIELILGSNLVPKHPGAGIGADAVIKVGGKSFTLKHPGWKKGSGWATAGEVKAWKLIATI